LRHIKAEDGEDSTTRPVKNAIGIDQNLVAREPQIDELNSGGGSTSKMERLFLILRAVSLRVINLRNLQTQSIGQHDDLGMGKHAFVSRICLNLAKARNNHQSLIG
jgi:hypothetical protein